MPDPLHQLLEGRTVHPGHRGNGSDAEDAVLNVIQGWVATCTIGLTRARRQAARVVRAGACPGVGVTAAVGVRELADGGIQPDAGAGIGFLPRQREAPRTTDS